MRADENGGEPSHKQVSSLPLWLLGLMIQLFPLSLVAEIQGYLDSYAVQAGDTLSVYVSTTESTYDLTIIKIAQTPRVMKKINGLAGTVQQTNEEAWKDGAGWNVSKEITVPVDWGSGVYQIQVQDSNDYFESTFVVAPPRDGVVQTRVLLLDNLPTVEAYNFFGGKNLYQDQAREKGFEGRGRTLSFARPKLHIDGKTKQLREVAAWLDAMDIDYNAASMLDLDADPTLLEGYALVIIAGHSEYWSRPMRENFDDYVARGGNAAILSGNTMWWQVRIEGNAMVCYKDAAEDPEVDTKRKTVNWWRYPVYEPEDSSTGLSWRWGGYHNSHGYYISTPENENGGYKVANPNHWIYEGTGLQQGDLFGKLSAIVGYETDGTPMNFVGGIPTPSYTHENTPLGLEILAYAPAAAVNHPDVNTDQFVESFATAVIFQHPSFHGTGLNKGWIFNASTISWADGLWSLEENGFVDETVGQVTENIVRRFSGSAVAGSDETEDQQQLDDPPDSATPVEDQDSLDVQESKDSPSESDTQDGLASEGEGSEDSLQMEMENSSSSGAGALGMVELFSIMIWGLWYGCLKLVRISRVEQARLGTYQL